MRFLVAIIVAYKIANVGCMRNESGQPDKIIRDGSEQKGEANSEITKHKGINALGQVSEAARHIGTASNASGVEEPADTFIDFEGTMDKIICIDKHHLKEEGKLAQDHIGKPKLSEDDWPMKVIKEIVRQNSQNDGANGSSSSMAQKGWQFDEPGETMRSDGKSPPRGQNRHQVKEEEGMPPRAQSGKYGFPNGLKPHELIHLFFNVPYGKRHESPLLDKMKKRSEKMKMRPDDAKKQPDSPRPNLTGENKQLNPNAKEYVPQKLTKAGSANPHNVGMQQPHPYSPFSSYIYGQNDVIPPPPPYKVGPNLSLGHQYRGGGGGGKEGVKKGGTGAFLPRGTGKVGVENSAKMKQHEKKDEKEETMKRNDEEDDGEEVIVYKGRKPTN